MLKNILKIILIFLFLFFLHYLSEHNFLLAQKTNNLLDLYVLNVGQGDAIFIQTKNGFQILIDGGPDNKVIEELDKVMPVADKSINYLILTHPHADHLVGLIEVLKRYDIEKVFLTGVKAFNPEYQEFLTLLKEKKIKIEYIDSYKKIKKNNLVLEFLAPLRSYKNQEIDNLNNSSIINKISYFNFSALLTGDAEMEEEDDLLKKYANSDKLKVLIYKVAHHGSRTASSLNLLKAMQAKYALISCGLNNKFKHPHLYTLQKLQTFSLKILRTDLSGILHCFLNEKYKVFCEGS